MWFNVLHGIWKNRKINHRNSTIHTCEINRQSKITEPRRVRGKGENICDTHKGYKVGREAERVRANQEISSITKWNVLLSDLDPFFVPFCLASNVLVWVFARCNRTMYRLAREIERGKAGERERAEWERKRKEIHLKSDAISLSIRAQLALFSSTKLIIIVQAAIQGYKNKRSYWYWTSWKINICCSQAKFLRNI